MTFKGTLWPYQLEAKDRMVDRGKMLLGVVMGGGKTVITLSATEELHDQGDVDRCLVVVPASLKFQWLREISKFTDAKATVIDGSPSQRAKLWRMSVGSRYVIVNPETLVNDQKLMGTFQAMVVDECTMIKNRTSKRSRLIKRIGKTIHYRFGLTGQPIENRPEELFSIMEFVDKDVLGTFTLFDSTFIRRDHWGKPVKYVNLPVMYDAMQDCMVRKTREDIADQLPKVLHTVVPVSFDTNGAATYRLIANDLLAQLSAVMSKPGFNLWAHYNGGEDNEAQGQIMSRLTVLRMLCDNPALVLGSAKDYSDPTTAAGSAYANEIVKLGWMSGATTAPKLNAVLEFLQEVLEEDPKNKVVLFSFFKKNLRIIQQATSQMTKSVLFMGGMSASERDTAKQTFSTDPDCRLFLSSDAGGYGVDLPMGNFLVSYDLPWSSGKLEQREARIIRLSSTFDHVNIVSFVMQGSIEERQYEMLAHKRNVNEAFIDGKHQDSDGAMNIDVSTLTTFLRESDV